MLNLLKKLAWDWTDSTKEHAKHVGNQIKSKAVRNTSALILALFVFIQAMMPASVGALNPRFNNLPGDYETLRGANSTAHEQSWHDPVSAKLGDVVSWNVYYHNNIEQTVAKNVQIQVSLPQVSATQLVLNSKLWADNADPVTDTGTVNLNTSAKIRYIPGSTQWYKDGSKTPLSLPDGVVGDGVNIGDINGCWAYAGFVVFQTEIISPEPTLYIDKKVGSSTDDSGTKNWVKENTANSGEVLAYRLQVKNTGNEDATNVRLKDALPEHTSYINGTTKIYNNQAGDNGQILPDGIVGSTGISLGNLKPGDTNSAYIVFQAKIASLSTAGIYTLVNIGTLSADNAKTVQSTASTTVAIGGAEILQSKTAYNDTQKTDATTVVAKPGDIINYNLWTKNNGQSTALGYVVSDDLSDILEYADVINAYGGVLHNGTISYPVTDIAKGQTINKTFSVKVKSPVPNKTQNGKSYDFIMENFYGNLIKINIQKPQIGYLFNKTIRNISRNESVYRENTNTSYGETVEYKIDVANTGNIALTGVKVWDVLPKYQTLIAGSVKYTNSNNVTVQMTDKLTSGGIELASFPVGTKGSITFKVKIASCPDIGVFTFTNTAYAITSEFGQITDTASVKLTVYPPVEPPIQ
jgi:uncharacterized repeat protein (TIGR01451 family)